MELPAVLGSRCVLTMNYQRPRRCHGVNCCCSANRRPRHRANASASGGEAAERRQPQAEPSCRRREREQHPRLRAEPLREPGRGAAVGLGSPPPRFSTRQRGAGAGGAGGRRRADCWDTHGVPTGLCRLAPGGRSGSLKPRPGAHLLTGAPRASYALSPPVTAPNTNAPF